MACHRLFRHPGLRALVLERCEHWQLTRERIPASFMATLLTDLEQLAEKQVDIRVAALLTKPDPKPRERLHKPKPPGKRALKTHPTLPL